jgi:hypothetical protein
MTKKKPVKKTKKEKPVSRKAYKALLTLYKKLEEENFTLTMRNQDYFGALHYVKAFVPEGSKVYKEVIKALSPKFCNEVKTVEEFDAWVIKERKRIEEHGQTVVHMKVDTLNSYRGYVEDVEGV